MTIRELKKDYPKLGALAESLMDDFCREDPGSIDCSLDEAFVWGWTPQYYLFWHEVNNEENLQQKENDLK